MVDANLELNYVKELLFPPAGPGNVSLEVTSIKADRSLAGLQVLGRG
jgi:hypothetical protein